MQHGSATRAGIEELPILHQPKHAGVKSAWDGRVPVWRRCLVVAACVLIAFGARYLLEPFLGQELPFMLFVPAALVSAWYGGVISGVVTLMLGLFLSDYFFFPVKAGAHSLDTVRLLRYVFTTSLGIGLIEVLHHSQRRTRALVAELQEEVELRKRSEFELLKTKAQLSNYSKELERHVAARTTDLANTLKSLKGVLYHMVHNFRAPLRAMTAYTELLVADCSPKLDTTAHSYAQHVQAAAKRMDTLIRDLLEYGRLGHVEIPLVKVSLENVIKRTLSRLSQAVQNKRAKLEVIYPLPDVLAQEEVLEEVLNCLLENALRFVAPGTVPRIQIKAELRDSTVRLWIADNGIGIDSRYHERIFEVFEKLHPQEGDDGTGIGLAIVKQGMERMGGRVGIESQPGLGSRFWMEFAMPSEQQRHEPLTRAQVTINAPLSNSVPA